MMIKRSHLEPWFVLVRDNELTGTNASGSMENYHLKENHMKRNIKLSIALVVIALTTISVAVAQEKKT